FSERTPDRQSQGDLSLIQPALSLLLLPHEQLLTVGGLPRLLLLLPPQQLLTVGGFARPFLLQPLLPLIHLSHLFLLVPGLHLGSNGIRKYQRCPNEQQKDSQEPRHQSG